MNKPGTKSAEKVELSLEAKVDEHGMPSLTLGSKVPLAKKLIGLCFFALIPWAVTQGIRGCSSPSANAHPAVPANTLTATVNIDYSVPSFGLPQRNPQWLSHFSDSRFQYHETKKAVAQSWVFNEMMPFATGNSSNARFAPGSLLPYVFDPQLFPQNTAIIAEAVSPQPVVGDAPVKSTASLAFTWDWFDDDDLEDCAKFGGVSAAKQSGIECDDSSEKIRIARLTIAELKKRGSAASTTALAYARLTLKALELAFVPNASAASDKPRPVPSPPVWALLTFALLAMKRLKH